MNELRKKLQELGDVLSGDTIEALIARDTDHQMANTAQALGDALAPLSRPKQSVAIAFIVQYLELDIAEIRTIMQFAQTAQLYQFATGQKPLSGT